MEKEIKQIEHINKSTIQKHGLDPEETQKLVNKFYHKSTSDPSNCTTPQGASADNCIYVSSKPDNSFQKNPNSGQWQPPVGEVEKDFALDMIIQQLVEVQSLKLGTQVKLPERAIKWLIKEAQDIFKRQAMMLDLTVKSGQTLNIVGDIHGQYYDLLRIFDYGGYPSEDKNYLFIGDYVDRGKQSIEVITLLIAFKVKYPETFNLLRGNHECQAINRTYGFYDECKRRYSVSLWRDFCLCFNYMPVCSIIESRILCMHGGLSPELHSLEQIKNLDRPCDVPDNGLLCDLLWSDPDKDVAAWGENERGVSHTFGPNIVKKFNDKHDLDLICRAHQVVEDGYEFFADRNLVTVFSAPNYYGEWDNAAAIMIVDEDLMCKFKIIQPAEKKDLLKSERWIKSMAKTKHPNAMNGQTALKV